MSNELVYLKPNVVLEPLVDSWYAWPHLISPATAAMNIRNRHLPIMNSYIQAPQIHASAVKNPKMRGGPFMDLRRKEVERVTELRDRTLEERAAQLALAEALKELNSMIQRNAMG